MRLLALLLAFACTAVHANEIAIVVRAGGNVVKTTAEDEISPIKRRDTLVQGDQISTGDDSYATLKFADEGIIDLAANATLKISEYQPDEQQGGKVLLELLSGQLRTITGSFAKKPDAYELRTDHASIGVRGTEFEVEVASQQQTLVRWQAGIVEVRSLEFPEQVVSLTEAGQQASVSAGSPAILLNSAAAQGLGAFPAELLQQIAALPTPLLVPIVPPVPSAIPAVVALDNDGATATEQSEDAEPLVAFVELVRTQQWPAARVLANELIDRFEGLPRFDLYHGILLMAEQSFDEAIFSFERVLLFAPDQHRARLELGRAYYLTQNYQRARVELEQVLQAKPPAEVKSKVEILLQRVNEAQRRSQSRTYVGASVAYGWDSNFNGGTDLGADTLDPNLLGLTELADSSMPKASSFYQYAIFTGQISPNSQFSQNQFNVDFSSRVYQDSNAADAQTLSIGGSLNQQNARWRQQIPVSLQWSRLNNKNWQFNTQVAGQLQYQAYGPLWVGVKLGTTMSAALNSDNNSSVKDSASIVFDASERGRVHSFSSGYLQYSQAGEDDGHLEWRGIANRYQLSWSLPWKVQSHLAIEHQWRRYKDNDLLFTVNSVSTETQLRQDQILTVDLQAGWAPTSWLQTQSQLNWQRVNSNINAYGRQRLLLSQHLSIRF